MLQKCLTTTVITIKFNLDGDTALRNNKNGSLGLLNEHMIEQNIVLNKLSLEHTEALRINLQFSDEMYSLNKNGSKAMVNSFRSKAKNRLKKMPLTGSGDAPHALDTCAGGSANMFLNSFRNKYANGTMGVSWYKHMDKIVPGKKHVLELVVSRKNKKGKNVEVPLKKFLSENGETLNTSKCKVK